MTRLKPYQSPNTCNIPQEFFDEDLRDIDDLCELKVMNAVLRKTYGFDKRADVLSISQLMDLTGMVENSVTKGLRLAEKNGRIMCRMLGKPGKQKRAVMIRNEENIYFLEQLDAGNLNEKEFLLMTTRKVWGEHGKTLSQTEGGQTLRGPKQKRQKPARQADSSVRGSNFEGGQAVTPQKDLSSLLVTDHSSLSLSSDQRDQVSASAARVSVPEQPPTEKGEERESEIDFLAREQEKTKGLFPSTTEIAPEARQLLRQTLGNARPPKETPHSAAPPSSAEDEQRAWEQRLEDERKRLEDYFAAVETGQRPVPEPTADTVATSQPAASAVPTKLDPAELTQRLQAAAAANWEVHQKRIEEAEKSEARLKPLMSQAPSVTANRQALEQQKARQESEVSAERARLIALGLDDFDELFDSLYSDCVDNPSPHLDFDHVRSYKQAAKALLAQMQQAGEDAQGALDKIITGFWQGRGKVHCLAPIRKNIEKLGLSFPSTGRAAHA